MLVAHGSFGCIYHPGQHCDGTLDKTHVSKIVNRKYAKREIDIGKRVKKIKNYKEYFVPILSSCLIQSSKVKRCKALYPEKSFMLMNMPFLKTERVDFDTSSFIALTHSIELLIKEKIVHFDIKIDNLIFTPEPRLIDFGISLDMKKLIANISDYFYIYEPSEHTWPIDVHLLCYMMSHDWTQTKLEKVCHDVYKHSPVLDKKELVPCIQHYSYVVSLSRHDCIRRLLKGWKTWDMYALTVLLFEHEYNKDLEINLHYNSDKRLSPRSSRLAARTTTTNL